MQSAAILPVPYVENLHFVLHLNFIGERMPVKINNIQYWLMYIRKVMFCLRYDFICNLKYLCDLLAARLMENVWFRGVFSLPLQFIYKY